MTKKKTGNKPANKFSRENTIEARNAIVEIKNVLEAGDLTIQGLTELLKTSKKHSDGKQLSTTLKHDVGISYIDCLKHALQLAVTLEFATIPPYLCALWSIRDNLHPVSKTIRAVVQEEMLHMALACNMLSSLGEVPEISSAAPGYPGGLPGGVHEGLVVHLSGLTKSALADFLWIERPVEDVPIEHPYTEPGSNTNFRGNKLQHDFKNDTTIGEFYDEIHNAFKQIKPEMSPDNQISGPLAWTIARNLKDIKFIIELIKDQGEGSENNPEESKGELSHYYRFLEVYNEREYKWNNTRKVLEDAGPMKFPEVRPVARVPVGGYRQEDVSKEVWYYLDQFDTTYTILLNQLQAAWTSGGQQFLIHSYETMFELERYAKPLMEIRTPYGGGETYAPCFRYKPDQDKTLKVRQVKKA